MNNKKYDSIIVGAGLAGAVLACELAKKNKKVLVIEKRPHVGGNTYEEFDKNGVRIHLYGPHIFHTNSKEVFEYVEKYAEWYFYEHRVLGKIDGQLVPIPFNFKSIELLFDENKAKAIKKSLLSNFKNQPKVSILDLISHKDKLIKSFGEFVYEKVFVHYTAKQWGIDIKDIDKSVINRVPVILGYDDRYFQDTYQFMPKNGYNQLINNLLADKKITIKLNTDADKLIKAVNDKMYFDKKLFDGKVFYTGQIDKFFGYKFGKLPYRSLKFKFENHSMNYYQSTSVVNYPNEQKYTRITEFKYLTNQLARSTTTLKEYPQNYTGKNIPYYPINNDETAELYNKYKEEASKVKGLFLCGRLAEYKYYNIDQVILKALDIAKEIK